jgi:membrane fusion protein
MTTTVTSPQTLTGKDQKTSPNVETELFRTEVLAEQQSQWLGTVLLIPRISYAMSAGFALLAAAGVLAILFCAHYTKTARIQGWLVPERGIIQIFAPQPGVLVELHVQEGEKVRKGMPLLALSTELQSEALGATQRNVLLWLQQRRASLLAEKERLKALQQHQMEELSKRLASIKDEQDSFKQDFQLQRVRIGIAERITEMQRTLFAKNLAPRLHLSQAEDDTLQQVQQMQVLRHQQATLGLERMNLEAQLAEIPIKNETQLAEADRNIALLEQHIAETEARRQIIVTAPEDGTVTAIQAARGSGVSITVPLLSIVPAMSRLKAQLFGPSRAVGFIRPGQRVLLRYEAFPYQKFGHYEGTVANISRSAMSPAELSQQLAGLTSLYSTNAPVYQINVALERQTVTAYGNPVALQPGMQLEADVLIERRRLIEWVLEPLFTLTGGWNR